MKKTVVLFAGFGAPPPSEEGIRDFLKRLSGREPSKYAINELINRYEKIGGSPFMEKVRSVCFDISKVTGLPCSPVMKYTPPFLEDVLKEVDGEKFIIFPLSPFSAGKDFSEEIRRIIIQNGGEAISVENWGLSEVFVDFASKFIKREKKEGELLFTAHSLPVNFQNYRESVYGSAKRIAEKAGIQKFFIGFQSGREGWLSPGIDDVINEIKSAEITLFPFGFFAECLETLYDLDILLKEKAVSLGIKINRLSALSEIEGFTDFLIYEIRKRI
jgi:ferrochelatase